jgi:hypothetical protein
MITTEEENRFLASALNELGFILICTNHPRTSGEILPSEWSGRWLPPAHIVAEATDEDLEQWVAFCRLKGVDPGGTRRPDELVYRATFD